MHTRETIGDVVVEVRRRERPWHEVVDAPVSTLLGLPGRLVDRVREGGGRWEVTVTRPDGRRTERFDHDTIALAAFDRLCVAERLGAPLTIPEARAAAEGADDPDAAAGGA